MWKSLLVLLVLPTQGIRMHQATGAPNCPSISDHENVLFWGMILDGKDHVKGKHVYDWHGFGKAYEGLDFLMNNKPDELLEFDHLMEARHICCDHAEGGSKGKAYSWAGTDANAYEGPVFRSYTCAECDHMKALLEDVPLDLFKISKGSNPNINRSPKACKDYSKVLLRPKSVGETKTRFKAIIAEYNADIVKLTKDEDKLNRLASFLKDYAFLHPWGNGNGRFRALMLNHEIRRLGLGCGSFMYNNNKDLYYITKKMYVEKIKEGIAAYNTAVATGKSPWTDEDVVTKHKERFNPNITMPGLMNCRNAEYTKTSLYKDAGTHEELEDGVDELDFE
jgi:hypothetical protein